MKNKKNSVRFFIFLIITLSFTPTLKSQKIIKDSSYYDTIVCKYGYSKENTFNGYVIFKKTNYKVISKDTTLYFFKRKLILFLNEKMRPSRVQAYKKIIFRNPPIFILEKKI